MTLFLPRWRAPDSGARMEANGEGSAFDISGSATRTFLCRLTVALRKKTAGQLKGLDDRTRDRRVAVNRRIDCGLEPGRDQDGWHTQTETLEVERHEEFLVEPTGDQSTTTGGRPAAIFRFRREVVQERPAPGLRLGAR